MPRKVKAQIEIVTTIMSTEDIEIEIPDGVTDEEIEFLYDEYEVVSISDEDKNAIYDSVNKAIDASDHDQCGDRSTDIVSIVVENVVEDVEDDT